MGTRTKTKKTKSKSARTSKRITAVKKTDRAVQRALSTQAALTSEPERMMRGAHQVENLLRELEELPQTPVREVAIKVANWILGDDSLGGVGGVLAAVLASNHAAPVSRREERREVAEEVDPLS